MDAARGASGLFTAIVRRNHAKNVFKRKQFRVETKLTSFEEKLSEETILVRMYKLSFEGFLFPLEEILGIVAVNVSRSKLIRPLDMTGRLNLSVKLIRTVLKMFLEDMKIYSERQPIFAQTLKRKMK